MIQKDDLGDYSKPGPLTPMGYEKVTALSAAKGLTVPDGARYARIQAEAQAVRYKDDGNNPTSTDGLQIKVGPEFELFYDGDLAEIKFLELAASATLQVLYYR
jgi:hypothetical protein